MRKTFLLGKDFGGELGTIANVQLGIDIPGMRDRRVLADTQFFRDRGARMSRKQEQACLAFPRRQRQIVHPAREPQRQRLLPVHGNAQKRRRSARVRRP